MGLIARQILTGDKIVQLRKIGGDFARDITTVIIIETGMGELLKRCRQCGQLADHACLEAGSVLHEVIGKARRLMQAFLFLDHIAALAFRYRHALARIGDRRVQEIAHRQFAAQGTGQVERRPPAAHSTGDGERRMRTAHRDHLMPQRVIGLERGPRTGIARGIKRPDFAGWFVNKPKTVPPDARHMRIDHSNRRPHRHHGLDGIAALLQNRTARFRGQMMRGCDGSTTKTGGLFHDHFLTFQYLFCLLAGGAAIKPLASHLDPI